MELGQVVLSRSGRDKGKYLIVVGFDESKEFVYLSDGDVRKLEKPKKKKLKHIVPLHIDEVLRNKLINGERISNPELKKHIRALAEKRRDTGPQSNVTDIGGG